MKAWRINDVGLETLTLHEQVPIPIPSQDEILVRVLYCSLNPADYKIAGRPKDGLFSYPHTLGLDCVGTVVVSKDKQQNKTNHLGQTFENGDMVMFHANLAKDGVFAEYISTTVYTTYKICDSSHASSISKKDLLHAAAMPCAGLTAYQALFFKCNLLHAKPLDKDPQFIVITAASGAVGQYAMSLVRKLCPQLKIIAICSEKNFSLVQNQFGVHYAIDYTKGFDYVKEQLLQITNQKGVDFWIDSISSSNADFALQVTRFGGHIACIGGTPTNMQTAFVKAISVHGIFLGAAHRTPKEDVFPKYQLVDMMKHMWQLYKEDTFTNIQIKEIHFQEIKRFLEEQRTGHANEKFIAKVAA